MGSNYRVAPFLVCIINKDYSTMNKQKLFGTRLLKDTPRTPNVISLKEGDTIDSMSLIQGDLFDAKSVKQLIDSTEEHIASASKLDKEIIYVESYSIETDPSGPNAYCIDSSTTPSKLYVSKPAEHPEDFEHGYEWEEVTDIRQDAIYMMMDGTIYTLHGTQFYAPADDVYQSWTWNSLENLMNDGLLKADTLEILEDHASAINKMDAKFPPVLYCEYSDRADSAPQDINVYYCIEDESFAPGNWLYEWKRRKNPQGGYYWNWQKIENPSPKTLYVDFDGNVYAYITDSNNPDPQPYFKLINPSA